MSSSPATTISRSAPRERSARRRSSMPARTRSTSATSSSRSIRRRNPSTPLPAGEISYGKLYQVLPFTNTIVSVDLSGAVLREVLEAASGSAGRLHIGGGAWAYRFANPAGQRVLAATVGGQPLDTARVYHV